MKSALDAGRVGDSTSWRRLFKTYEPMPGAPEPQRVERRKSDRPPRRSEYRSSVRWEERYATAMLGTDALAIVLASVVAVVLRVGDRHGHVLAFALASVVVTPVWVLAISFGRGYETRFLGVGSEEFRRVAVALAAVIGIVGFVCYATRETSTRGYVLIALPLGAAFTIFGRYLGRTALQRLRSKGRCRYRVLVVGSGESATALIRLARKEPAAGWDVVAACLNRSTGRRSSDRPEGSGPDLLGVPVVGTFDDVLDAIGSTKVSTIAVAGSSDIDSALLRRLMWDLEGSDVHVLVASALTDITGPRISIQPVAGLPLLRVEEPDLSGARRLVKATVDRTLAAVLLVVLSPLLLGLAVLIRVKSEGPALFRQVRAGRKGRHFVMYKYRSMYLDAESRLAEVQALTAQPDSLLLKVKDDPRVTPVGRFLRSWSLDELPQLLNALNGTMSLVGPRPPLPGEVAQYETDVHRRLMVKPGLTGVWQVNGRSDLEWDEAVRLDLRYVENWSLAMDFAIMWRTVSAVLRRSGAY